MLISRVNWRISSDTADGLVDASNGFRSRRGLSKTQPLSPLTMLLSRHTRRREFITLVGGRVAARAS
jgi:hypothetical protein